jgi:Glutamyl-tRNA reductase
MPRDRYPDYIHFFGNSVTDPNKSGTHVGESRRSPAFIIDIAVPRDAVPTVNEMEGVYLYDIDALQSVASSR